MFAWSSFEVMEMECGNLAQPLYAIPPRARARMQLRFPVNVDYAAIVPAVRRVLKEAGYDRVVVTDPSDAIFRPAVWTLIILGEARRCFDREDDRQAPAILPNLGGSLPNNIFLTSSACQLCGYRIPIRDACSTRPMNICLSRSSARGSPSWRGFITTSDSQTYEQCPTAGNNKTRE